jgi:hypothetical protein
MKKNILITALAIVTMITCSLLASDGLTYIVALLMALTIIGALHTFRSTVMKITRWAKANPKKAQWVITVLHFVLMLWGVIIGKNLKELDFHFSEITPYVFSAIMIIGFLSVPFWPKRNTIALPREVNRQRLAYLGISLSSLIISAQIGNKIGDLYPNSPITQAIEKIDQTIFSDQVISFLSYHEESNLIHSSEASVGGFGVFAVMVVDPVQGIQPIDQAILPNNTTAPTILNKAPATKKEIRKANKEIRKNYRKTAAAVSGAGTGILIFLLVIVVCVGGCLFAGGIAAVVNGEMYGIIGIIAGPLIVWGAVKGIKKLNKKYRESLT